MLFFMVDIFQNGDNKNCKSKQHHKFFVCTHRKRLLPFKARKRRYSHPIGSPGKHIMFSWCGVATVAPVQGGTFWPVPDGANFGLGGRKIALTSE